MHSISLVDVNHKSIRFSMFSVSRKPSFVAAAERCTRAIESFEKLVEHIDECGDEKGNRGTAAFGTER